ncbi:hypothetical protein LEMLEM_LOCUS22409 [Lemmus lemmus]
MSTSLLASAVQLPLGAYFHCLRSSVSCLKGERKVELVTQSLHCCTRDTAPPTRMHPSLSGSVGGLKIEFFQVASGLGGQEGQDALCGRVTREGSATSKVICQLTIKMEGPHQVAGPHWRRKLMERNPRQVSTKRMSSLMILFNPESPNLFTHRTIVTKGPIQGTVLLQKEVTAS